MLRSFQESNIYLNCFSEKQVACSQKSESPSWEETAEHFWTNLLLETAQALDVRSFQLWSNGSVRLVVGLTNRCTEAMNLEDLKMLSRGEKPTWLVAEKQ